MNRCVDIVVGLSAGSEGKGKYISNLAETKEYGALVRTGGPNAAHTVIYNGDPVAFHMIPCGSLHSPNSMLIMGAGAILALEHLFHEIEILKKYNRWLDKDGNPRLVIDPQASVIDKVDLIAENGGRMPDCGDLYFHPRDCEIHNNKLNGTCMGCEKLPKDSAWAKLGSTTHGTGVNLIRKMARGTKMVIPLGQDPSAEVAPIKLARDYPELKEFIGDTVKLINTMIDNNTAVMLEGTQGAMLSLHHSYWPKCTSRDTNASQWCTDAGVSPLCVRDVYGVTRTFPIRVAGNSGPLSGTEITWEEVTEHATGQPIVEMKKTLDVLKDKDEVEYLKLLATYKEFLIEEVTTATKRRRRVFLFGEDDFKKAMMINRPTNLMLTFVDYLNIDDFGKSSWDSLSQRTKDWITTLESKLNVFFNVLSTGPATDHTIFRKSIDDTKKEHGKMAAMAQAR